MVIISDYKMLKEMFSQSVFSGRMDFRIFDFGFDGNVHGKITLIPAPIIGKTADSLLSLSQIQVFTIKIAGFQA